MPKSAVDYAIVVTLVGAAEFAAGTLATEIELQEAGLSDERIGDLVSQGVLRVAKPWEIEAGSALPETVVEAARADDAREIERLRVEADALRAEVVALKSQTLKSQTLKPQTLDKAD